MRRSFRYVGPQGPRMVRPHQNITIYTRGPAPVQQDYYSYDTYSDQSYESYNDRNQGFTRHYYGAQHQEQVQMAPPGHYIPLDYPPAHKVVNLCPQVSTGVHYTVRPPRYQTSTGFYEQPSPGVTVTTLPPDYSYEEGIETTSASSTTLLALPAPPEQSVTLRAAHPEPSVTTVVYQEPVPRHRYQRPQFSSAPRFSQPAQTNQYFGQVHTAPQPQQALPALPAPPAQPEQAFDPAPTHQYTGQPSRPAAPAPPAPQYSAEPEPPATTHQYQYTGQPSRAAAPAPPAPQYSAEPE